ncbi:MAG: aldo/keto reductase [Dehalococcoidia bacterium]|jgi:uncharacterized protein|nr:aldo/keto reductase [Dehalococcoidia bacterium]
MPGLTLRASATTTPTEANPVPLINQRRLGRTNLNVTELGLGAMDTPTSEDGLATLEAAHTLGINFIDTARDYAGSEFLIGRHIRERRTHNLPANLLITSKTFSHTIHGSQRDVDRSLATLGLETIPLYQLHDISTEDAWREVLDEDTGALTGLKTAQFRGLIDHVGVSSHNTQLLATLITSGHFDAVMLEYSAFFPETAPLIDLAAQHDVGVIVMRPLGGSGRTSAIRTAIDDGYDGPLTPANLLRYVLSNPNITTAIPGARHPNRIEANVATATSYTPMPLDERRTLEQEAARLY